MNILIYTLGCPKNFNDSQVAAGILEAAGHTVTLANDDISDKVDFDLDSPEMAAIDAVMVNTCGFINDAKTESIEAIFTMSQYGKLLIVSGCLSQRYGEELYKEIPEVDLFIGVNEYDRLPALLEAYEGSRQMHIRPYTKELESPCRKLAGVHYAATVKISEGCNNACTFCAIPGIRGPYRSRPKEKIIAEVRHLAEEGVREIILIAQDTTTYGIDLYGRLALAELLRDLCRIDKIRWIRIMYCYEDRITDELIETIAQEKKICKYLDIPIQHISDGILKAMRRRSDGAMIRERLAKIRAGIPGVHIRTTLIVGFPGETEEDFEELLDFVEEQRFERLGAFMYSPEDGTPAAQMPGQIDEAVKAERLDAVMRRQVEISLSRNEEKVGRILDVLVEGEDEEEGCYIGRTGYDAPGIDNNVLFSSKRVLHPGEFVKVRITDAFDYDLVGEATEQ
ncbi:MAG: 30S ribosomal protein S12 methylthiotransferase RimO [Clostridiales bacterium]|nr:30S ribosomal protein S12 methylthiotransferase RimO [Clostridiales bacterium]